MNRMHPHSACRGVNRFIDQPAWPPLVCVQLDPDSPRIWCKLEFLNPSGSTKDRIASFILTKALRSGQLAPDALVIEASSGSTSIALALACAQLGLRFLAIMPRGVSDERSMMIRAYGGEVLLTERELGIRGAIARAEKEAAERGGFLPRQFENPDNAAAHRHQTAPEIVAQLPEADVDAVVSGIGTGGTLVGLFQGFRDYGCQVKPFAARPISGGAGCDIECCSFSSRIPGVIDGLSKLYDKSGLPGLVELDVDDRAAMDMTRRLIRLGFPVGPSSGLNYQGALQAARHLPPGARIVTVFPDRMERYFSTELFAPQR